MSERIERKIGLGWTADKERVIAFVSVEDKTGTSKFTNHTEGPTPPRVSVSFEVVGPGPARTRSESFGQVPAEDRVIVRRHDNDASDETRTFIEDLWTAHHLNDMNAACDHMTPEMLARKDSENTSDWQTRMLDTVVCPETGYRWGHAWLSREIPADVLDRARALVSI